MPARLATQDIQTSTLGMSEGKGSSEIANKALWLACAAQRHDRTIVMEQSAVVRDV